MNQKAPLYHDDKILKYEEVFRSACPMPTKELAESVLNSIRSQHRSEYGWVELDAYIEETEDGFIAVRNHAQYL